MITEQEVGLAAISREHGSEISFSLFSPEARAAASPGWKMVCLVGRHPYHCPREGCVCPEASPAPGLVQEGRWT